MSATIIDGKAVAAAVRAEVGQAVGKLVSETGVAPGLATILVGDDAASAIYVGGKQKACAEVGIQGFDHRVAGDAPEAEVADLIERLNADEAVSGILLQLPVPGHMDGARLTSMIDPDKDVDGLTPISAGRLQLGLAGLRPCTPSGVIELLDRYEIPLEGAEAVVVGRSNLVGKPMASLLLERHATVTVCHSRTRDLAEVCRRADVLVAAVGRAEMVRGDWIKPGAAVIDVGMNRGGDRLLGDVEFEAAAERAGAITPVPGGVGPMTIACLLRNTLRAADLQRSAHAAA